MSFQSNNGSTALFRTETTATGERVMRVLVKSSRLYKRRFTLYELPEAFAGMGLTPEQSMSILQALLDNAELGEVLAVEEKDWARLGFGPVPEQEAGILFH